jgi:hypothetical protein
MYVDQHVSVADICQMLRISPATFYRYVALGRRAAGGLGESHEGVGGEIRSSPGGIR